MHNIPAEIDICIVGAGPAGASASLFLAQMGIPHLLVDKATFPRDKICGDGLDFNTIRVLNQFNPELVPRMLADTEHYLPIQGIRVFAANGKCAEIRYKPASAAFPNAMYITGRRADFDHFLLQQIDTRTAQVALGVAVTAISRKENGIELTLEQDGQRRSVFTRLVIGADGDHSVVLRTLGERKIDRASYAAALRMYGTGVADISPRSLIDIYLLKKIPFGYLWIFPLSRDEYNVGLGLSSNFISRHKINLRALFKEIIGTHAQIAPRLANFVPLETPQGWGLPLVSNPRQIVGDNYLLAGDAAGLIHPFSGEGIGSSMISGWVAAQFAAKAVEARRFDAVFQQAYQQEATYRFQEEARIHRFFNRTGLQPLYAALLDGFIRSPFIDWAAQRSLRQWAKTAYATPLRLRGYQ